MDKKLEKLLASARELMDQSRAEKDATRAKELHDQGLRAFEYFEKERDIAAQAVADAERADAADAREAARAARQLHRPTTAESKATGGTREITRDDILTRAHVNRLAGRHGVAVLSDQQREQCEELFPVEALFAKVLRGQEQLTDAEAKELRAFQRLAISPRYRNSVGAKDMTRAELPLTVGVDAQGGFTISDTFMPTINRLMKAYGPMADADLTRRINTPRGENMTFVKEDGRAGREAQQILERGTLESRNLTFSQATLSVTKWADAFLLSAELEQDNEVGLLSYVYETLAEALARGLNKAFTAGDGSTPSGKPTIPTGILESTTTDHTTGGTAEISFDDLFAAHLELDQAYRGGERYFAQMHSGTLAYLAMTKDTAGRYLITPTGGVPGTGPDGITPHGIPVRTNEVIPVLAANKKVAIVGDHRSYITRQAGMIRVESFYDIDRDSTKIAHYSRWGSTTLRGNESFCTVTTAAS